MRTGQGAHRVRGALRAVTGLARITAVVLLGLAFGGFGWVIGDSTAPSDRDAAAAAEDSSREAFVGARLDGSESARSEAYAGALSEGVRRGQTRGLREGFKAGAQAATVEQRRLAEALEEQRRRQAALLATQRRRAGQGDRRAPEKAAPKKAPRADPAPPRSEETDDKVAPDESP